MDPLKNIYDKLVSAAITANECYYIEAIYLSEVSTDLGVIPEVKAKQFLIYENNREQWTENPAKATVFDFALGAIIVTRLKKSTAHRNITFALVTVSDEKFIEKITPDTEPEKT